MNVTNCSEIPNIAKTVLDQVEKRVTKSHNKQLSDEDLLTLHSVFGPVLQQACDILEKYSTFTIYITANNTRSLIEVKGEQNRCYRVFPRINYCHCRAFKHQVIEKKVQIVCKHVLAARIAQILGKITEHRVTLEQYLMLIRTMFEIE